MSQNILIIKNPQSIEDFKKKRLQEKQFTFPDVPFEEVQIHTSVLTTEKIYADIIFNVYVVERHEDRKVDFDIVFGANYVAVRGYRPNVACIRGMHCELHCFDEPPSTYSKDDMAFSVLNSVVEVFDYILNHSVTVVEKQTVCKKEYSKNGKVKAKHKCRYITTTKYIITGCEKRKRSAPTYTLEQWSVRGFYRTYKSGKKIFIKPSCRQRRCNNGRMGEISQAPTVYKI